MISKFFDIFYLAYLEIKAKYIRSFLGPFWITLSTCILIGGLSLVFFSIFNIPLEKTIPWISSGIITWQVISTTIDESTQSLINDSILNINQSLFELSLKNVFKNQIIFYHNIVILIPVFIFFKLEFNIEVFEIFYGFLILFINSISFMIILSLLCLRYRDFIMIIKNLLYMIFLITPIFWMPDVLTHNKRFLAELNPLFQIIQTVRDPFLGNGISLYNFIFTISFTIFFVMVALFVYHKYKRIFRIWL